MILDLIQTFNYLLFTVVKVKGAGGGLHRNSLEIDFIVVSDRGE